MCIEKGNCYDQYHSSSFLISGDHWQWSVDRRDHKPRCHLERPNWEAASLNSCFEVRKVKRRSDFFRFGFCRSRTRKSSNGSNFDWSTSSPLPPNSFALGVMITSFLSSCRSYPRIIVREGYYVPNPCKIRNSVFRQKSGWAGLCQFF